MITKVSTVSAAYLSSLRDERTLLRDRVQLILEESRNGDTSDSKSGCGMTNASVMQEVRELRARIAGLDRVIVQSRNLVLTPPATLDVLAPGLRAHLRPAYNSGRVIPGYSAQAIDVGVDVELCPSRMVPIYGANCRQIRPFMDQKKGFHTDVLSLSGEMRHMKLVCIEPTPLSIAA